MFFNILKINIIHHVKTKEKDTFSYKLMQKAVDKMQHQLMIKTCKQGIKQNFINLIKSSCKSTANILLNDDRLYAYLGDKMLTKEIKDLK